MESSSASPACPKGGWPISCASAKRFRQILAQAQDRRDGPGDLRNLDGVGEAVAEVVGQPGSEDLGLILQPSKRPRVNYAVAVAAKFVAIGVRQFRIAAAAGALDRKAQAARAEHFRTEVSWTAAKPS